MEILSKTSFTILIAVSLFGCNNNQKGKKDTDTVTVASPIIPKDIKSQAPKANSFDYEKTKVISQVFVIFKQGVSLRETNTEQANIVGKAEYGQRLEVVEKLGDWIAIRERIGRNYTKEDGTRVESSGWEKVYVAKNETGTLDQIELTQDHLNIITSLNINQKSDFFEKGKALTTHLKLELIDQSVFERQKSNAVDFYWQIPIPSSKKMESLLCPPQINQLKLLINLVMEITGKRMIIWGRLNF